MFTFLRRFVAIIFIISIIYTIIAVSYSFFYRLNKLTSERLSFGEKSLLVLVQPLTDIFGNGRIGGSYIFKNYSFSHDNDKGAVAPSWPTGSEVVVDNVSFYTSQNVSAVIAPAARDAYWRIGYCEEATPGKQKNCYTSQVAARGLQAIQNYNNKTQLIFGVNDKDEFIDVRFEYFLSPKELGSIPLL